MVCLATFRMISSFERRTTLSRSGQIQKTRSCREGSQHCSVDIRKESNVDLLGDVLFPASGIACEPPGKELPKWFVEGLASQPAAKQKRP